jgi:myo-inositol-1(or 4)-monophosphatase
LGWDETFSRFLRFSGLNFLFLDYAAGEFIVREAGGYTCDPAGGTLDLMSRRCICAASKELADELVPHITQYYPTPRDD